MAELSLEQLDNPAARVEAILSRAHPLAQGDTNAFTAWKEVFEAETDEDLAVRAAQFITQIRLAREAIEVLPESEHPEHLLTYFPVLDKISSLLLSMAGHAMAAYRPLITTEVIYSLAGCSIALRRHGGTEPTFDSNAIIELLGLVSKITVDVIQSDLPPELKLFVAKRLQDVESALRLYRITGFPGVEYAVDGFISTIWRTPEGSKKTTGNWIVRLVAKVQSFASGSAALAVSTQKVIESVQTISGD